MLEMAANEAFGWVFFARCCRLSAADLKVFAGFSRVMRVISVHDDVEPSVHGILDPQI
jgi:hypothetical protein